RACALFVGLAAVVAVAAEGSARFFNGDLRLPVYAGGAAGIALGLAGLPFAVKLAKVEPPDEAAFWKWWGGGVLTRLFLLLALALGLGACFKEHLAAALLTLTGAY